MARSWLPALVGSAVVAVVAAVATEPARAQDWAQWRGPGRDGRVVGFKTPAQWPAQLTKKWTVTVGEGHSSPILVGNRAYVTARRGEQEVTLCLNAANGSTVWEDKVDAPFDSVIFPARRLGKSPRSTPLYKDGKLYTTGVNGLLTCYDAAKGKILWRKDFAQSFTVPMPTCGASLSPLVDGKKLYVHVGHDEEGAFYALDKDSGKEIWSWKGQGPAYTSPVLATIGGKRQIVTAAHNDWIGLDPENGALLWKVYVRQNMFNHNSITPLVIGDRVVCGGNQRPTFVLQVKKNGAGWSAEKLWETRDVTLSTSSPLLYGTHLVAVNEKRRGQITCMDLATGKVTWTCDGNKGENVTLYDLGSFVLAATFNGEMIVYRKVGETLVEKAKYALTDSATWASPALAGNRILARGEQTLTLWEVPGA
jgi:outer membrane protein assembly factor BamB